MGKPYTRSTMAIELTTKEKERGRVVFDMMDVDQGGTIDVQEICIVHESDKEAMIKILDADGNSEVDPGEWEHYLYLKKQEKGKKKFGFFLNYLEQEVPKNLHKIKEAKAAKEEALGGTAKETVTVSASATNVTTSSDVPRSRELKPEFKQALDVLTPPQLGLKNNAIKDAFTNLMLAIQDLDTAVGAGKPENTMRALHSH